MMAAGIAHLESVNEKQTSAGVAVTDLHTCIKGVEFQKSNLQTENCFEIDSLLNSFHQRVEFNTLGKLL